MQKTIALEATTKTSKGINPRKGKGKWKVSENLEEEQSCKMKENSILEKVALAVEAKREKQMKREWRKREEQTKIEK